MKILGIELSASQLIYVLVDAQDGNIRTLNSDRVILATTRSRNDMVAFRDALRTIFSTHKIDLISIKQKPERGRLAAGPAALKMEALILANSPCEVVFVSGHKVNEIADRDDELHSYKQVAYKVAVSAAIEFGYNDV